MPGILAERFDFRHIFAYCVAKSYTGGFCNIMQSLFYTATDTVTGQPGTDSLTQHLVKQVESWLETWKPQFELFYRNYEDREGLVRATDTKGVGIARTKKADRLYLRQTRNKIRGARAKVKDAHQSNGRYPYWCKPRHPILEKNVSCLVKILDWQLDEMEFWEILGDGTNSLATYGTGTLIGPFPVKKEHTLIVDAQMTPFGPLVSEKTVKFEMPVFYHQSILDVIPDPDSSDTQKGLGCYWKSKYHPEELHDWLDDKSYKNVKQVLSIAHSELESDGLDWVKQLRANRNYFAEDGRVVVYNFAGLVPRWKIREWDGEKPSKEEMDENPALRERVEVLATVAGGVCVRCIENPYPEGRRPIYRAVWEKCEDEFYGVGIATNNEAPQRILNASVRLFLEGKSIALMPPKIVQKGKFVAGENFILSPDKTLYAKENLTPEEVKGALQQLKFEDVTEGWQSVIALAQMFSDDDTAVTKYTQGTDSRHLNPTATGISLIMGAASLPLKEAMSFIDLMWIEPVIEALIDWNLEFLKPEVVEAVFGPEEAQYWTEIQSVGKKAFMSWRAVGAQNFMQREILFQKMQALLSIVAPNPELAKRVKWDKLLDLVWKSLNTGEDSPIMSPEEFQQQMNEALALQQEQIDREQQMEMTRLEVDAARDQMKTSAKERIADKQIASNELQTAAKLRIEQETKEAQARGEKKVEEGSKL
jgi:hypothetical protein